MGESRWSRNERGEYNGVESKEVEIRRNKEEENIGRGEKKGGQEWREERMSGEMEDDRRHESMEEGRMWKR